MYGYGVFETLRTYEGEIFALEKHIERLFHSAQLIGLKHDYKPEQIQKWTKETFQKYAEKEARIKIVLTETELIIWPQELILRPAEWYETGIKVVTFPIERVQPLAKSLNCLPSVLARQKAQENNVYEALFVDRDGFVREGSYSNLFWIKDQVLYTTKDRVLKGITREVVLDLAQELMPVREENWLLSDVLTADEVFITNTTSEILPVIKIDKEIIRDGLVGKMSGRLADKFRKNLKLL